MLNAAHRQNIRLELNSIKKLTNQMIDVLGAKGTHGLTPGLLIDLSTMKLRIETVTAIVNHIPVAPPTEDIPVIHDVLVRLMGEINMGSEVMRSLMEHAPTPELFQNIERLLRLTGIVRAIILAGGEPHTVPSLEGVPERRNPE